MSEKDFNTNNFDMDGLDLNEDFSLESILAEYKSDAYIVSQKKTPKDILNAETEKIVNEARGIKMKDNGASPQAAEKETEYAKDTEKSVKGRESVFDFKSGFDTENAEGGSKGLSQKQHGESQGSTASENGSDAYRSESKAYDTLGFAENADKTPQKEDISKLNDDKSEEKDPKEYYENLTDDDLAFFNSFEYASKNAETKHEKEVGEAIEKETGREEKAKNSAVIKIFDSSRKKYENKAKDDSASEDDWENISFDDRYDDDDADVTDDKNVKSADEEEIEEPNLAEAYGKFASGIRSMSLRSGISFIICVLMAIITFTFDKNGTAPFGIGGNSVIVYGILLIMQIFVMILCVDIIVTGLRGIFKGAVGIETLVAISCILTVIQTATFMMNPAADASAPFCVVSASSALFALRGKRSYRIAIRDTLRSAVSSATPHGIVLEDDVIDERSVLKKTTNTVEGFYRNLMQMDISERAYSLYAPMIIAIIIVFAVIDTASSKKSPGFIYDLTALFAISASFTGMMSYSLPFKKIAGKARNSGAAIAGWGGACDIADADSAIIADDDIFPPGTLALGGVKIFDGISQQKAITYTASIVIASDSGVAKVFAELLKSQGYAMTRVEDFACYTGGGIGGNIHGERVLVGSAAFMNLMGIRVPDSINAKNAIFTAINNQLIGVFAINYTPANSVQKALVSILKTKVSMLFAVRDFNLTPAMLQQKFKVSMAEVEQLPIEECYKITENDVANGKRVAAIASRGGLGPMAEIILMGTQLKLIATLTTIVSIIGSVIGVLLIFGLFLTDLYHSVTAGNILIYMFLMYLVVWIISSLIRRK